jgi:hypothetical protein
VETSPSGIHSKEPRREAYILDAFRPTNDYKCLALDNSLRIINHPSTPIAFHVCFNQTDFPFLVSIKRGDSTGEKENV